MKPEELLNIIDNKSLNAKGDCLDVSFGEIQSMYLGGELIIDNDWIESFEFQWTNDRN